MGTPYEDQKYFYNDVRLSWLFYRDYVIKIVQVKERNGIYSLYWL